jgi:hypothetical protein
MTTAPSHPPRRAPAPTGGAWYIALALLSWGTLAPVAFLHAAARQRSRAAVARAAAYTAAVPAAYVLGWAGLGGSGTVVLLVGIMIVALVHLGRIRREIWPPGPQFPVRLGMPGPGQDPAVAAALAGRIRREESRRIAATDRLLARELRIGRPDLPHAYDDGGLVDLNHAPAAAIASVCGLDPATARRIVEVREAAGVPFTGVDDVFAWTVIPLDLWDLVRDRGIVY